LDVEHVVLHNRDLPNDLPLLHFGQAAAEEQGLEESQHEPLHYDIIASRANTSQSKKKKRFFKKEWTRIEEPTWA
jgi:hypothetical protein